MILREPHGSAGSFDHRLPKLLETCLVHTGLDRVTILPTRMRTRQKQSGVGGAPCRIDELQKPRAQGLLMLPRSLFLSGMPQLSLRDMIAFI